MSGGISEELMGGGTRKDRYVVQGYQVNIQRLHFCSHKPDLNPENKFILK